MTQTAQFEPIAHAFGILGTLSDATPTGQSVTILTTTASTSSRSAIQKSSSTSLPNPVTETESFTCLPIPVTKSLSGTDAAAKRIPTVESDENLHLVMEGQANGVPYALLNYQLV